MFVFHPTAPNFYLIENARAKLEALLRKAVERILEGLWRVIVQLITRFRLRDCDNYFIAAG